MATKIKFGTDGWRAIIAGDFTFDNVSACAQGVADYLKSIGAGNGGVVIGYDTRFASEDFAATAAEVIAGNGIKAFLFPRAAPTPVTSYTVTALKADGAIMITASHNPSLYNGFKYKVETGSSASTEIAALIEQNTNAVIEKGSVRRIDIKEALQKKLIVYHNPYRSYARHLGNLIDLETIKKQPLRIVVDSMFGAGIGYFRSLLEGGQIEVHEINRVRNPLFPGIQPEPIDKNLSKLARYVIRDKATVGFATDGDADRIGVIDENGVYLNTQQIFALLALYFLEVRKERGAIIKTLTSTDMLFKLGKIYGVPVFETPVGFKYVAPLMIQENALLGGEESGGYGFRGHIPERDGILAGLYILDFMIKTKKTPSKLIGNLFNKVGAHYYDRIDLHATDSIKQDVIVRLTQSKVDKIGSCKVINLDTRDGFRYKLEDDSWLLIRFSGTEPLIRIYAEGYSRDEVQNLLQYGRDMVGI